MPEQNCSSWTNIDYTVKNEEYARVFSEFYTKLVDSDDSYAEEMCGSDDVPRRKKDPKLDYRQAIVRCFILERRRQLLEVLKTRPTGDDIYGGLTLWYSEWLQTRFEDWERSCVQSGGCDARNFDQLNKEFQEPESNLSARDLLQYYLQLDMGITSDEDWRKSNEFQFHLEVIMWGEERYEEVQNGDTVYQMIP